jgi:hypothetical protein
MFIAGLYSVIAFCVISYITVIDSLLQTTISVTMNPKPVTNIGFPYKYYFQFWLNGSDSPNCGWNFNNFLVDLLLTSLLIFPLYFLFTKKRTKQL